MSKQNSYYIGIDGGGTRCRVRLCDEQLRTLASAEAGSANVFQDTQQAWQSVQQGLQLVAKAADISPNDLHNAVIVAGLAGAEVNSCAQAFLQQASELKNFTLLSDAQIACLGAHQGQEGAIFIIGTGTIGLAYKNQQWQQIGGWGFPLDDIGSGAWLGQQAVRAAIAQYDQLIPASTLTERVWHYFNEDKDRLIQWSQTATSGDYGKLAPLVTRAFCEQDAQAENIIFRQIAAIGTQLNQFAALDLPICLLGGLSEWLLPHLNRSLQSYLTPAKGDALSGALLYAKTRNLS